MWTDVYSGGGDQKSLKMCGHPLWMTPWVHQKRTHVKT